MPRRVLLLFFLLLVVCRIDTPPRVQAQAPPVVPYSIFDLGSIQELFTSALAINEYGAVRGRGGDAAYVVGYSRISSGANHAFIYDHGDVRDLGTLGGTSSVARGVTYDGRVVGESRNRSGINRAFLYENGAMRDLGALNGTGRSFARAINNEGVIVGGSQAGASADSIRAFVYQAGTMTPLAVNFGGTRSVANDISSNLQIVGSAHTAGDTAHHAFLYDASGATDLGTLGGSNSEATAVNERGDVVGRSQIAGNSAQRGFLYADGDMINLGTLGGANSEALAINDARVVVGTSQITGRSTYHAFIWRDGVMIDLNTLLPPDSGWVLERASGISAAGEIVGRGRFGGRTRAFAMTPPVDVVLRNFGNDQDGNLPRPIQTGRLLSWVVYLESLNDLLVPATNVLVRDTLTGPVEYESVHIEGSEGTATCEILGRTLECRFPRVNTFFGELVRIFVRTTAAGPFGHTTQIVEADQADPDLRNNQFSETNLAISLQDLAVRPATVAGGKPVGVFVTLTAPHMNGAVVRLSSSNPAVFPVPATFVVPFDQTRAFNVFPAVVSAPTTVEVTASYGLVTRTATLTVVPPALSALQLTPTTAIGGCGPIAARVTLTGAAPASGAPVAINETLSAAQFPTALVMPAGTVIRTFSIPTTWVTAPQSGPVTATFGGATRSVTLTVRPVRAQSIALTPNPVRGGATVTGVVTLECPAQTPVVVALSTGNSAVAAPPVSTMTIPVGQASGSFALHTSPVSTSTSVPIYARVFGIRRTATLVVNP